MNNDKIILYIEDDEGTARLVRSHLERFGYLLEVADSAESGLKAYDPRVHKLIIMDYVLPGMNGLDALKKLAPDKYDPAVLMITAAGSEHVAVEAMNTGAAYYVMKNNTAGFLDLLPVAIESALAKRDLYKQNRMLQDQHEKLCKEVVKLRDGINQQKLKDTNIGKIADKISDILK